MQAPLLWETDSRYCPRTLLSVPLPSRYRTVHCSMWSCCRPKQPRLFPAHHYGIPLHPWPANCWASRHGDVHNCYPLRSWSPHNPGKPPPKTSSMTKNGFRDALPSVHPPPHLLRSSGYPILPLPPHLP